MFVNSTLLTEFYFNHVLGHTCTSRAVYYGATTKCAYWSLYRVFWYFSNIRCLNVCRKFLGSANTNSFMSKFFCRMNLKFFELFTFSFLPIRSHRNDSFGSVLPGPSSYNIDPLKLLVHQPLYRRQISVFNLHRY